MLANPNPKVVIVGGGVIGICTSYYLSQRGITNITLVDQVGIAAAASGKAGGFLAADWSSGAIGKLSSRSFQLHATLGGTYGDRTDYRRLTAVSVSVDGKISESKKLAGVEWADVGVRGVSTMGDDSTIAQVHPKKLCETLWAECESRGGRLLIGKADGVKYGCAGQVEGLNLGDGTVIDAEVLVVAMGPWTCRSHSWFKPGSLPKTVGVKYHSVVAHNPARTLQQAVFFQGAGSLEVYPRPRGEVYITGYPDEPVVVTEEPGSVEIRDDVCERIIQTVKTLSTELNAAEEQYRQSCYLPCCPSGDPVIGPIAGAVGAFVATGHSCWGILNAPATGEALAELIVDGRTTHVDLAPFAP